MHQHIAPAAAAHVPLVKAATDLPLTAPTPCAAWDLRGLLGHLLYWTPLLAAVGRREDPAAGDEARAAELVTDDWPARLDDARSELAAVWSDPAAWQGTVVLGEEVPAAMIGGMVLGELVVHGWDLGRSVGTGPVWPADVLAAALDAVSGTAEQGRGMGVFAGPVDVPAGAPVLDRIVAVTGRSPAWTS
ncbi:hypothetical protein FRP1_05285 [Pseudonocardia sp. EC080625-04]|uniref:TIGR03086 family metal-binding protein n=2 Tax=Pseudonocardia TaxID=1847 RepID=UPI0006CB2951|nr:TIGR03086 family metal-binding protein [Pseudonocardia sp. EC080625-04]ALE72664.1 hypothetical protein FRP1_05285 [Pseudonocardia sp. EC080625-04]